METIVIGGEEYALGCLDRVAPEGSVRPCLESAMPNIPESQWQPCDYSRYMGDPGSQGQHGSCTAANSCSALMANRAMTRSPGYKPVQLSQWDLYGRICGGRDNGSVISDAIRELTDNGVCERSLCDEFTLKKTRTEEQKANAALYRLTESYDCPNRASIASAIQRQFPTPLGVKVYQNFESLENVEGHYCVPWPRGRLRGGHCVVGCGMAYFSGEWWVKLATLSWTKRFGENGCVWYRLRLIEDRFADAWGFRFVTVL